jgi:MFS family permease
MTSNLTLVVLVGIALYGAGYGLAVSIIPAFLLSVKGLSQPSISIYFSLFYIALSVSQLVVGPLSDKRGRQGFMIGGMILTAVGLAAFPPMQQPGINLPLVIFSLGLGIFCVSSLAYLNECVADSFKGVISGAYYLFWGIGYFLGPLLLGKAGNAIGFSASFYLVVVLFGVEIILLLLGSSQMSRAWGQLTQQPLQKE